MPSSLLPIVGSHLCRSLCRLAAEVENKLIPKPPFPRIINHLLPSNKLQHLRPRIGADHLGSRFPVPRELEVLGMPCLLVVWVHVDARPEVGEPFGEVFGVDALWDRYPAVGEEAVYVGWGEVGVCARHGEVGDQVGDPVVRYERELNKG